MNTTLMEVFHNRCIIGQFEVRICWAQLNICCYPGREMLVMLKIDFSAQWETKCFVEFLTVCDLVE